MSQVEKENLHVMYHNELQNCWMTTGECLEQKFEQVRQRASSQLIQSLIQIIGQ